MHETSVEYLRWIPLLPLIGAAINGFLNRRLPNALVSLIGCGTVLGSFALSVKAFLALRGLPEAERMLHDSVYRWISIGDLHVDVAFAADALTGVMILFVTGVAFLIHVYSIGYMKGDGGFARFFAYLNLFVFAMLVLVLADNLLLLFVGWEGVGLCSYLLIGFWYSDLANSAAGKKAFLVNRIGDFAFLIGMFVIYETLAGHVDGNVFAFSVMKQNAMLLAPVATLAALLLFGGATGKSAQIPLFIWLPDAMAGPTPVSALIHAATMVTAGVYMVARMFFLYDLSGTALLVIGVVAAATALVSATIAVAQNDIKKVLAYSTVSQLGYMFMACAVGAYSVGIFHVMTHAFFKALLFLGAGSVIHGLHHQQDMRRMGGIKGKMPLTFFTMALGTLAISGIFPLAGFFSKDEILYESYLASKALWLVGFFVAGLTAFYMARLMALTFYGKSRVDPEHAGEVHESPATMTIPLVILGILSVVGGWVGWPHFLGGSNKIHAWLAPVFGGGHGDEHAAAGAHDAVAATAHGAGSEVAHTTAEAATDAAHAAAAHGSAGLESTLAIASTALAIVALTAGFIVYTRRTDVAERLKGILSGRPYQLVLNKYYVDEIYEALIVKPGYWISQNMLWRFFDRVIIDGLLVNGVGRTLSVTGALFRLLQNGLVRWYAYSLVAGAVIILVYLAKRM